MKHWKDFLLVGLVIALVYMAFTAVNKNEYAEAKEVELKRQERELRKRDGQIRELLDSLHKQDLEALKWIQAEKVRADRAEEDLIKANERLKKVRFVAFGTDTAGRAGAIKDLYPSY